MCVTGLTWVLAALLSWRASLERRKGVFFLLQAKTGPSSAFLAFFSCLGPAGTGMTHSGRQGEEAAQHGYWHCPQGELFLTAGIMETALKNWQNQPLSFFAG